MKQAPDCDMVLAHDDNLVTINGFGHDAVSRLLNSGCIVLFTLAVPGNPRTRHDDDSTPEVQLRDTSSFVW